MEPGCSIGSKWRQQLSGSPVSTCDHGPSASPFLTEVGKGENIAFCGSTGWHLPPPLPLGKTDGPDWNTLWARLTLLAASWAAQYPFTSLSSFPNSSTSNAFCLLSPSFLSSCSHHSPPTLNAHATFPDTAVPNSLFNTCLSLHSCCPLLFSYFFEVLLETLSIMLKLVVLK